MRIRFNTNKPVDMAPLGDVNYGQAVIYDGRPYIKLNKRALGQGIALAYSANQMSLLLNPKIGSLRVVSGDEVVQLLDATLDLAEVTTMRQREEVLKPANQRGRHE